MATHNESIELSRSFYADPSNYDAFSLTKFDARRIIGCIDPRDPADEQHGQYKIMIQNAGAGAGEAQDMALAETADSGQMITVEEGLRRDKSNRLTSVLDAHPSCKFIGNMAVVLDEIARPSAMTTESVDYWAWRLEIGDVLTPRIGSISAAADRQKDYIAQRDSMEHLVESVDTMYPNHQNVHPMRGANVARVYTINLHPNIGINRNKKDVADAEAIQGYHDNVAASISELGNARGLSPTIRGLRLTALVLRAAAVRTVLTRDMLDEMAFFEVRPTADGVRITEGQL